MNPLWLLFFLRPVRRLAGLAIFLLIIFFAYVAMFGG